MDVDVERDGRGRGANVWSGGSATAFAVDHRRAV